MLKVSMGELVETAPGFLCLLIVSMAELMLWPAVDVEDDKLLRSVETKRR